MSYEEAQQEAAYDEFVASLAEELYDEHRDQAIEEFITERLLFHCRQCVDISRNF